MAEEDDKATPVPKKKEKGHATLVFEATEVQRKRDKERRTEEDAKDEAMQARLDRLQETALEQANRRADDLQKALDSKDRNMEKAFQLRSEEHAAAMAGKDKTIKLMAAFAALLLAGVLVAVFDKTVGFNTTTGEVNAGNAVEAPK